jgi:hypothetical protein
MSDRRSKVCRSCGRSFAWRRRWARDWDRVRYCSRACSHRRVTPTDRALEQAILGLLDGRPAAASICPSEAARAVAADGWRELMEPVRRAARRLAARGQLEIVQRGHAVDPSTARGPIRLRMTRQRG